MARHIDADPWRAAIIIVSVYTLSSAVELEIDVRKSRFIAKIYPVEDRVAALAILHDLREQHPAATHLCWALLAGGHSGMSDDGEPSGTAGRPMLEVLRHHELDGVLATVVRYYGGIKLGTGGLMRAYRDAIAAALKQAQRVERIAQCELAITLNYADAAIVRRWIERENFVLVSSQQGAQIELHIRLPAITETPALKTLADLTQGRAQIVLKN